MQGIWYLSVINKNKFNMQLLFLSSCTVKDVRHDNKYKKNHIKSLFVNEMSKIQIKLLKTIIASLYNLQ